jgi:transcriptional regulator with GAF, ATPase, and Fis domain
VGGSVTAWLAADGSQANRLVSDSRRKLRAAGVDVRPLKNGRPSHYGVLVFDAMTERLLEDVTRLCESGAERIVLVAVDSSTVAGDDAWRLLAAGASDVCARDSAEDWAVHVGARLERWRRVDDLVRSACARDGLVGESAEWRGALREAVEAACFTDTAVLVTGETGTGKELVARLIHFLDARRRKRELVVVDCTTIVPTLSGSEFFGHERGAFTGAVASRDGAFALADGGTLFLDEVGELPLSLQGELLRVVQEGVYKRVGGNDWRHTSFRLICATNRDLVAEAAAGRFRHDLLYRIAGSTLRLPSLRERPADILLLARHFLGEACEGELPTLDNAVRKALVARDYPGNVRDLRHLMTRIAYRHAGRGLVTVGDLPAEERPLVAAPHDWRDDGFITAIRNAIAQGVTMREIAAGATDAAIRVALAEEGGSLQGAARRLGLTPRALQLRRAAGRLPVTADGDQPDASSG